MKEKFQYIELSKIKESKTNPRLTWEAGALQELAESIKQYGIIQPIVVRKKKSNTGFELISGARRLRAAKIAGLDKVPAIIKNLSDDEALEIQIIENLQRQDIHPLEESDSFISLIKTEKYDVKSLAEKIGKSVQYVYSRIRLNNLSWLFKERFAREEINFAAANLLSRLQLYQQAEILEIFGTRKWEYTVNEIKSYIDNHRCIIDLRKAAPFNLNEYWLNPNVGACACCLKNSGCDTQLFPDSADKQLCTDKKCFEMKVKMYYENRKEKLNKKYDNKVIGISKLGCTNDNPELINIYEYSICKKDDKEAKPAIIADGDTKEIGKLTWIRIKKTIQTDNTKSLGDKLFEAENRGRKLGRIMAIEEFVEKLTFNHNIEEAFLNPDIIIQLCKIVRQNISATSFPALKKYMNWDVKKTPGISPYYDRFDNLFEKHSTDIKFLLNLFMYLILWREIEIYYDSDDDLLTQLCKIKDINLQGIVAAQIQDAKSTILYKQKNKKGE